MAGRNAQGKNVLKFGKASMYVIAEDGLQREKLQLPATAGSSLFSGKTVVLSRTKAMDFCWKEFAHTAQHNNATRVLDLNGSVRVDVDVKRYTTAKKNQRFTGAEKEKYHFNQPCVCLNAAGVNNLKQTTNDEHERVSCLCSISIHGYKKSAATLKDKDAEKKLRRESDNYQENVIVKGFLEKETFSDGSCSDSMPSKQRNGNSIKFSPEHEEQSTGDAKISNNLRSITKNKNAENSGRDYLKNIFYFKGNNHSKPNNQGCLPQIQKKTENQTVISPMNTCSSNAEKTEQNEPNRLQKSNQLLLPLNVSVGKNKEKQKHHFQSIVKLPTVVDKKTGKVHLALGAIAYEQSDYNKWSRKQKRRITPGNTKTPSRFSFPVIARNSSR